MVAKYLGVEAGETIRQIKGEETDDASWMGYTYTYQIADWFRTRGIPAVESQSQAVAATIRDSLQQGYPVIYLRYWNPDARSGGHFVVASGYDEGADIFTLLNPWGGVVDNWSTAQVDENSVGHWLVIVQQAKEAPMDPIIEIAAQRFAALGVPPNRDGAPFKANVRRCRAWVTSGNHAVLDPTPTIRREWAKPDGSVARLALDCGQILQWHRANGLVYLVEAKNREAAWAEAGWNQAQGTVPAASRRVSRSADYFPIRAGDSGTPADSAANSKGELATGERRRSTKPSGRAGTDSVKTKEQERTPSRNASGRSGRRSPRPGK